MRIEYCRCVCLPFLAALVIYLMHASVLYCIAFRPQQRSTPNSVVGATAICGGQAVSRRISVDWVCTRTRWPQEQRQIMLQSPRYIVSLHGRAFVTAIHKARRLRRRVALIHIETKACFAAQRKQKVSSGCHRHTTRAGRGALKCDGDW